MENNRKKIKIVVTTIFSVITLLIIGFSYAWFQGQIGPAATANVLVDAKTTDVLTFNKGNDITIQPTQANFGSGAGNRTGSTTATATLLANNDTNSATETYNLYFEITSNSLMYTTAPTNTPELLLTITNPNNQAVTSLTGLTYTTVNGVSGFDITTKKGLIQIASDYTITSTGSKTDTWTITVTYVNLDSDQSANSTKKFSCNVIIQKNEITTAMMDTGVSIYSRILNMTGVVEEDESSWYEYYELVESITAVKLANELPNNFIATPNNTVSDSNSTNPIYMWFEEDPVANDGSKIQYYYSDADIIYLNANSDYLFSGFSALVDIDDLEYFNTTFVNSMAYMFNNCGSIYSLTPLTNWDVSSVTNMFGTFLYCTSLPTLSGLENWDVSSVTSMNQLFGGCWALTNINAVSDWNVSSVTDMYLMFSGDDIVSLSPLANWNVSLVTNMHQMFSHNRRLANLNGLENWDVSSVINMSMMFYDNDIVSLSPLANWDVSSVTSMYQMFSGSSSLTSLEGLQNWDVSSVTNMRAMFSNCSGLTTASAINDWNVNGVAYTSNTSSNNNFYRMFYNANNSHPTFSRRDGYWDADGSFIPST